MTALQQQNALLHNQLEDVNTQAAKIRQTATAAAESLAIDSNGSDTDSKIQQLREVIAFVRKEKEIVDLQLHLAQVDNTRVKSENERLATALDETRATLLKVRNICSELLWAFSHFSTRNEPKQQSLQFPPHNTQNLLIRSIS
jgi:chromosome segregation ATPase